MSTDNRFNIDFFEFSFLVEACIPPRPIARAMFWYNVIDKHYAVLTSNERANLFKWITGNVNFDPKNDDCQLFYDRYNPDNQFLVTVSHNNQTYPVPCFLHKGEYHTHRTTTITRDYIIEVTPDSFKDTIK